MRRTGLVVLMLSLVLAPACSTRQPAGARDAASPADDASSPTDTGGAVDAGPRDTGTLIPDVGGGAHDAGADAGHDGGHDAGMVDANRPDVGHDAAMSGACMGAIDVSAGGTFTIDTCAGTDHFTTACGATSGLDAVLFATEVGSATHLDIADTGWVIQQLTNTCGTGFGGTATCTTLGSWGSAGSDGSPRFYWGVERQDGTCGSVDVVVTRTP